MQEWRNNGEFGCCRVCCTASKSRFSRCCFAIPDVEPAGSFRTHTHELKCTRYRLQDDPGEKSSLFSKRDIWQTAERLLVMVLTSASPPLRTDCQRKKSHVLSGVSAGSPSNHRSTHSSYQHVLVFKLKALQCGTGCRSRPFPLARLSARPAIQGSRARPASMRCVFSPENPERRTGRVGSAKHLRVLASTRAWCGESYCVHVSKWKGLSRGEKSGEARLHFSDRPLPISCHGGGCVGQQIISETAMSV